MRYKATVLLITLFSLFNHAFCQTQWSNEEIRNILVAQFKDFKPLADFYRVSWDSITFTTARQSHIVFEAKNVMINLNQVKKHVDKESGAFARLFCDYLLAHEFAHKFQFNFSERKRLTI